MIMKRKVKFIFTFLFIMVLAFSLKVVYAGNTSGGGGSKPGGCSDGCEWKYSGIGVRLSLYKYNGKQLSYIGSEDYCAGGRGMTSCFEGRKALQTVNSAGKVAYQNISNLDVGNWVKTPSTITLKNSYGFSNYHDGWNAVEQDVINLFSLESDSKTTVLNKIKTEFSPLAQNLTTEDLGYIYITIEPTLLIQEANNKDTQYYASAYEYAYLYKVNNYYLLQGITTEILGRLATNIMAQTQKGIDTYKFVGGSEAKVTLIGNNPKWNPETRTPALEIPGNSANRQMMSEATLSKEGYGINVFWLGNYPAVQKNPTPSCSITESSDKKTYTLKYTGVTGNVEFGISNKPDYISNKTTYQAEVNDTIIYGVVKSNGKKVATCSLKRTVPTCESTCSGKSGDSLLACAENYCQVTTSNTSGKKKCITTCGYAQPSFSSCTNQNSTKGSDTTCDSDATSSKGTCTAASTETYYKTVCKETSTIFYGNSLPVELVPGSGFSYTPRLTGTKTCEMTFESSRWKFDYAASYTDAERNRLLNKLKEFQNVSKTSIWAKDSQNNYKYDSSNADITMDIATDNTNKVVTKKLEALATTNLLDQDIVISSAGSIRIPLYAAGTTSSQTIFRIIETKSSNETSYRLPAVCIDGGNGEVYDASSTGECKTSNDGPYYRYFTGLKIEENSYNTYVKVTKNSSNMDVTNTCHYNIEDDNPSGISCSILRNGLTFRLIINNKYGEKITYGISDVKNTINNQTVFTAKAGLSDYKVYGTIKKGQNIVATCESNKQVNPDPIDPDPDNPDPDIPDPNDPDPNNPDPNDPDPNNPGSGLDTCVNKFKASEYKKIAEYCNTNWMTDSANYASEKDCYISCSYGRNTCMINSSFTCDELDKVETYCKSYYQRDGYKTPYSCINDCSCTKTPDPNDDPSDDDVHDNCLGVVCNYTYRPISLKDPFPKNRLPGANWYGREIFITDDLQNPALNNGADPEYVIELTPRRIDTINANTKTYNLGNGKNAYIDYVYKDEYSKDGKYESKFIHVNDPNNGGFYSYFTMIDGKGV